MPRPVPMAHPLRALAVPQSLPAEASALSDRRNPHPPLTRPAPLTPRSQSVPPPLRSLPDLQFCRVCLFVVLPQPCVPLPWSPSGSTAPAPRARPSPPLDPKLWKGQHGELVLPHAHSVQQGAWSKSASTCCTND